MSTIQILERTLLSDQKYRLERVLFEKPSLKGEMHHQENEVYFRPDAVTVLLVDEEEQKFLFTKQFRLPTFLNGSETGYLLESCAGLIDEGETPEQAAYREVKEETGYDIKELTRYTGVYSSAGGITEYIYLFTAIYNSNGEKEQGGGLENEGEDIEIVEMSFNDAKTKLFAGEFRDAKTMMLLQHYFLTRGLAN
ncbi:NUDIX hydrolase [Mucilaginibacter terrenus]|uniref:GDP-mannose pyrophosphatase n=1 Tax=Mucilaginibacter terrenus TaxID=2482727 RepID=A0A3E2NV92_9SPHI|nr:NUDIX hydrolase [Mucilaginibacter terrenus]RFZ84889.1 NUDIX hydrolase [Mucilaginibacter terrenus]